MHGGNIYKYQREHKTKINEIVDFSANINPFGMSQKGLDAIDFDELLHYPDPEYFDLKKAIGDYEDLSSDNIVLGNGAIECIFLLAEALKLSSVTLLAPTFSEYERAFSKYGECRFHLDTSSISDLPKAQGYVICNPNNPTGQVFDEKDLLSLLRKCEKDNSYLIIDEAFLEFSDASSMKKYQSKHLFILKSITKFFAVPGLRMGYLLAWNKEIIELIAASRMPWPINQIAARYTEYALKDYAYIEGTIEYIKKERKWMSKELKSLGMDVYSSGGNYLFFFTEIFDLDGQLRKDGILIRSCSNYRNLGEGYFRVAVKKHDENLNLLARIKGIIDGNY